MEECKHGVSIGSFCQQCIDETKTDHLPPHLTDEALDDIREKTRAYKAEKGLLNPLDVQVGGNHYKGFAIQPIEYTMANNLNFLQGSIVKRITRYDQPTGKGIEDLKKIKHECDLLINFIKGVE